MGLEYNIAKPWLSLDDWQKEYIKSRKHCFLLCGRQVGKSTAMSIKAGEIAIETPNRCILMIALTERQAYNLFFKTLDYLQAVYPYMIAKGKDKPTKHEITLKNGSVIMCHPTGLNGDGLRTYTITNLFIDEASRISDEVFVACEPMLSVTNGVMDIASTPCGKGGKFYEYSKREDFDKFYVSAEDCPRHPKDFLETQKKTMSKLQYAQEFLAVFIDELRRVFSDELLEKCCILERPKIISHEGSNYMGVDVGSLGDDPSSFEIVKVLSKDNIIQVESQITRKTYTTETVSKIIELDKAYKCYKIGIDNGGVGVAVFHPLLKEDNVKRKIIGLNNSQKELNRDGTKKATLLKEDMYMMLLSYLESGKLKLLKDDEVISSLKSIQYEIVIKEGRQSKMRIFGSNSHVAEGLIRAVWLVYNFKNNGLWVR